MGAQAGAQVVAQLVPQEVLFFLKQSNKLQDFFGCVAQAGVVQADFVIGAHTDEGAQDVVAQDDFLHLKQSNKPFFGAEPQPLGAQLTGVVQTGLPPGPHTDVVAQDDFLHLKQSNKLFFGAEPQPLGAQLTGVVQTGLVAGPQTGLGAQLVEVAQDEDFFPSKQSNRPHFFFGWVAQATGGLHELVVHPFSQMPAADTTPVIPSEATAARLMHRIHFIVPCLLPLGLFREPSWPFRERGLRCEAGRASMKTAVRSTPNRPWLAPLGSIRTHCPV